MNSEPLEQLTTQAVRGRGLVSFVRAAIEECKIYAETGQEEDDGELRLRLHAHATRLKDATERAWALPASHIIADLYSQGWKLQYSHNHIWGSAPGLLESTREGIRARLSVRRDAQLATPSVAKFLKKMESWRSHLGNRVSVISLLRDGRDLASALQSDAEHAIQPYVQFVSSEARCEFTGLRLQDIWRYFRLTWSSPYESIPGRSLQLIVRDSAAPNHPVVGIAALSSAAVRLGARDRYIGWDTNHVVDALRWLPTEFSVEWSLKVIGQVLSEIYAVDLIRDGILPSDHRTWTRELVPELRGASELAREAHHKLMGGQTYKVDDPKDLSDEDWAKRAELPLFRAKRAAELANLIDLRAAVESAATAEVIADDVLSRVVRYARSRTVGTEIADLTVCGAIAPYSHLAVGKLVALLAVSPAVIREYNNKYGSTPSIIASSVAGKAVFRPTNLVYVGTTSLYGKRPNQYDRLAMPAEVAGGKPGTQVRYQLIRDEASHGTTGVGTFHFLPETLKALEIFGQAQSGGWKVNNVFGEGTSPKLRGLRDGFTALGFDADRLLVHGIPKCVYGVKLAKNVDRYLLGIEEKPEWLVDLHVPGDATQEITRWWAERWGLRRLQQAEIVNRVRGETLIYPIRHAGRVAPKAASLSQSSLFDD